MTSNATTTTYDTLNRNGWACPECDGELVRSGAPNAEEWVTCKACEYAASIDR